MWKHPTDLLPKSRLRHRLFESMTRSTTTITDVPTSIVSGFLGVGKTTAIGNLLKKKPENERWAVLINEFGEVGVDASLLETGTSN